MTNLNTILKSKPGFAKGLQRLRRDLVTEQQQQEAALRCPTNVYTLAFEDLRQKNCKISPSFCVEVIMFWIGLQTVFYF